MINAQALLADLKRLIRGLEADLRETHAESEAARALEAEWNEARGAARTALSLAAFREDALTQSAVHWVLACVFLRFIEDNGLVERPWLAGSGERMHLARDRHSAWFRANPRESDLDYLLDCFREAAALPGLAGLFDQAHNPLFRLPLSGDGAMALLGFFRAIDPDAGALVHDFTDPDRRTRFLGDLYQDLSEAARKRYALLQTPEFVERFILERTLDPAIKTFGFREVRLIDPACGSGHFLLGAFERLFQLWSKHEPGLDARPAAQRALDAVAGVDINPFAAEIARFRLLLAALRASGIARLADAPDYRVNVAVGDSLLHGVRFGRLDLGDGDAVSRLRAHRYAREDDGALSQILGRPYHAVVANPPYITPKDTAENAAYRSLYASCHMKYGLAVPFIERCFDLAVDGRKGGPGGFVGMIVANSFMKREFGKKLIETFLPKVDLTHVIDTAGAYIPGHGTPTTILFGRHRKPVAGEIRTVMGIKGEPATPADPAKGAVWSAILQQIDQAGSESAYVSVADTPRATFAKHPWSIGGGGAADLKEAMEEAATSRVRNQAESIGFAAITGEDEAFVHPSSWFTRSKSPKSGFGIGDVVRDWSVVPEYDVVMPYFCGQELKLRELSEMKGFNSLAWQLRTTLSNRLMFGKKQVESGLAWWEYRFVSADRLAAPMLITFAFVATHNHFVLDRGGKVFKQSAPVIKLPPGSSEDDHLALLGLLNSSTACFWMKQVFHNKGVGGIGGGIGDEDWEPRYEHTATGLLSFPLVEPFPTELARDLDRLGQELSETLPAAVLARGVPTRADLDAARDRASSIRRQMIAWQEELDWRCYRLYGLLDEALETPDPPEIGLGERAFEIVMARQMAAGDLETTWFDRHGSTPVADIPAHWPADYRALIEARIALIDDNKGIGLIERPEYKRRWQGRAWEDREREALRDRLLDRLEDERYWPEPMLQSTARLADRAALDDDFRRVAELYVGRSDIDLPALVQELVMAESVPFLPVLRYTESGLRKRAEWERTWALQRREDAIDAEVEAGRLTPAEAERRKAQEIGDIPVPPKYRTPDFQRTSWWRLRGGLDVPKERFVAYPHAEREADGSPVVTWAGFDHLQQAHALSMYYIERKERDGWPTERLLPLLAGVADLLPWLAQWHNDYDSTYGMRLGAYYADFVATEARALDTTVEALSGWTPPEGATRRRRGRRRREAAQ